MSQIRTADWVGLKELVRVTSFHTFEPLNSSTLERNRMGTAVEAAGKGRPTDRPIRRILVRRVILIGGTSYFYAKFSGRSHSSVEIQNKRAKIEIGVGVEGTGCRQSLKLILYQYVWNPAR